MAEIQKNEQQLLRITGFPYIGSLGLEFAGIRFTGVETVDDFVLYNSASLFGAAFWACVINAYTSKSQAAILSGLTAAGLITAKELFDATRYPDGFDTIDFWGGLVAIAVYVVASKSLARP